MIMVAALAVGYGCTAERRTEPEIAAHPESWTAERSSDFHGRYVVKRSVESCRACHGTDLGGGGGVPACVACHGTGESAGHPDGWVAPSQHGEAVAAAGPGPCADCHGAGYLGGWCEVSCFECHDGPGGHPERWLDHTWDGFHGDVAIDEGTEDCQRCHGADLDGGTSGVACSDCHGLPQ
jgi:hypothetical protein